MNRARAFLAGIVSLVGTVAAAAATALPQWGVALEGNPITAPQLAAVKKQTGLAPRLVVFFQQWPEDPAARDFPRASLDAIAAAGAMPVITWEPMFYRRADASETMIPASQITGGAYDRYIESFARAAAAWERPVMIRFAHEMNLSRYHWGGSATEYGPGSPARFQAMWRHVVDIFRRLNVANVRWAFCPNCESVPGVGQDNPAPWNTAKAYYPGDAYVDALGMDGYNWGNTQTPEKHGWRSSWRSFSDTFAAIHGQLRALAADKPLYVFETASAPTGGSKPVWLAELPAVAQRWKLAGVVWFEANKEVDWRLTTAAPPAALRPLQSGFSGNR